MRRRLRFDGAPGAFVAEHAAGEAALAARLVAARDALPSVRLPDRQLVRITGLCARLGVDGVGGVRAGWRWGLAGGGVGGGDGGAD